MGSPTFVLTKVAKLFMVMWVFKANALERLKKPEAAAS